MASKIRREFRFRGRVQGVGFRYTTQMIARGFPNVCGYVQNLDDGSVKLVVEGCEADLQRFADEIRSQMCDYLRQVDDWRTPATHEFHGFSIRH